MWFGRNKFIIIAGVLVLAVTAGIVFVAVPDGGEAPSPEEPEQEAKVGRQMTKSPRLDKPRRQDSSRQTFIELAGKGSLEEAKTVLQNLADKEADPQKLFEDYRFLSEQLIETGRAGDVVQLYEEAVRRFPDDPRFRSELGMAYAETAQTDQARRIFEQKLAENPNDPEAHFGLGVVDRLNGDYDGALSKLNTALQLDPGNVDAKYNMAEILAFEKKEGGAPAEKYLAERYYSDLLQQMPDHPDLQNGLASVYLSTGRADQAVSLLETLTRNNPSETVLFSNLSESYVAANRPDEAIASGQKALEIDPNNGDAYFFLGSAEIAKGNQQEGIAAIRKAAELEPGNQDYQKKLKELGL